MRIRLIHWNDEELEERAARLRKAGAFDVIARPLGKSPIKTLRAELPDVFVIDLSRLPSHGREVGLALRQSKSTRMIPIVFVDGEKSKVERIRQALPDAVYCPWGKIAESIDRAASNPPRDPIVPAPTMAGYSGTPLPKKLGIKSGMTVALINAPDDFVSHTLGALAPDVTLRTAMRGSIDLILYFTRSRADLERRIGSIHRCVTESGGAVWIAWPKKASGRSTDVTQNDVRRIGLDSGLVDFKICAVDETWSALKFTTRKA